MSFLFRKRIKILPGVWLNLSKGGASTSFGGKVLTFNLKEDKVKTTASLPGSGLSYKTTSTESAPTRVSKSVWIWVLIVAAVVVIVVVK